MKTTEYDLCHECYRYDIKYKCVDTIKNTKKHGIVHHFCKVHKDAVLCL